MARADVTIVPGLEPTLYAAKAEVLATSNLYKLNPLTGAVISVGNIGFAPTGMDFDPVDNTLYAVTSNNSNSPTSLITINTISGAGTLVADLTIGGVGNRTVTDISFHSNGQMYGWFTGSNDLVTINKATGAMTQISVSGLFTFGGAIAFNANDILYQMVGGEGDFFGTINHVNGAVSNIVSASFYNDENNAIGTMAFGPTGVLNCLYNQNYDGEMIPLMSVNLTTGVMTKIADTVDQLAAIAWQF